MSAANGERAAVTRSRFAGWLVTGLVLSVSACIETETRQGQDTSGADAPIGCGDQSPCSDGAHCDVETGTCVDCLLDEHCASGVCHPESHLCVQCVDTADCTRGVCHPGLSLCVGCYADDQCDGVCHPERRVCVGCLDDGDCGPDQRCNVEAATCVGPCREDPQCDDGNACTIDRCELGRCLYEADDGVSCTIEDRCDGRECRGQRTEACCAALTCRDGVPEDGDGDFCDDRCRCADGSTVGPEARCPCPEEPRCPSGSRPFDADRDGCRESCECTSGAIIAPGAECPCRQTVTCQGGLVGADLDGDGC
ncbi:MAG TPA: hypothetical protein PK095_25025, partial [Myxococcota bacterium]|nr:hypothetical protein [Myxococcota bacterium]